MISQKLVAFGASSILALNVLMLLFDERFAIFPYLFGLDIRYVLTIGFVGLEAVTAIIRRAFKQ